MIAVETFFTESVISGAGRSFASLRMTEAALRMTDRITGGDLTFELSSALPPGYDSAL